MARSLEYEAFRVSYDYLRSTISAGSVAPAAYSLGLITSAEKAAAVHPKSTNEEKNDWLLPAIERSIHADSGAFLKFVELLTAEYENVAKTLKDAYQKVSERASPRHSPNRTPPPSTATGGKQPQQLESCKLRDPSDVKSEKSVQEICKADELHKEALAHYSHFVCQLSELLTRKSVSVDNLLLAWAYLTPNREVPSEAREANSVEAFMLALRDSQQWYSCAEFRIVATRFGGKEGGRLVATYERQLRRPVKKMAVLSNIPKKAKRLIVKLKWQNYTDQDIVDFRNTFARLLKCKPEQFVFKSAGSGCVQLTFVITAGLCEFIRSLVIVKTTELKKYRVMSVSIDAECIWSESRSGQDLVDPETDREVPMAPQPKRRKLTVEVDANIDSQWERIFRSLHRTHPTVEHGYDGLQEDDTEYSCHSAPERIVRSPHITHPRVECVYYGELQEDDSGPIAIGMLSPAAEPS